MAEFSLGYCKIPIYSPQKVGSVSTWDITQGTITRLLHPGQVSSDTDLHNIINIPTNIFKGLIFWRNNYNLLKSELNLTN